MCLDDLSIFFLQWFFASKVDCGTLFFLILCADLVMFSVVSVWGRMCSFRLADSYLFPYISFQIGSSVHGSADLQGSTHAGSAQIL